jgi:hypothetical protein
MIINYGEHKLPFIFLIFKIYIINMDKEIEMFQYLSFEIEICWKGGLS